VSRVGFEVVGRHGDVEFIKSFDLSEGVTRRDLQTQVRKAMTAGVGGVFFLPSRLSEAGMRQDEQFLAVCSVAIGLILELFARGLAVPRDIAVIGFDHLPIGNLFTIGVTTYTYPAEAIVRHALHVMRQRVEQPNAPPIKVSVGGELIVRESTGGLRSDDG
jgi:hypothetical protein